VSPGVDVTVLVPVLDERARLPTTAPAMLDQDFAGEIEFLFIDGGSRDGTRAILQRLAAEDARVRVLDNPRRTIPAALNLGLAVAGGTYVARMDAHSRYPRGYVRLGVERLERGDVRWVTGPAVAAGEAGWAPAVEAALTMSLGQGGSGKWTSGAERDGDERDLDTGVFCGIWRKADLDRLGGWDERFPVNEDAEMAGRVLSSGGRIVCLSGMAAAYAPRDRLGALARQYWRFGMYRVLTSGRHPVALRPAHIFSAALALTMAAAIAAPRSLRRVARGAVLTYTGGLIAAAARARAGRAVRIRLPVVLATMHLSWGVGFVTGCLRWGVPVAGLRRIIASRATASRAARATRRSGGPSPAAPRRFAGAPRARDRRRQAPPRPAP
jgi:succinoglycan biosynthesis protein ExoA